MCFVAWCTNKKAAFAQDQQGNIIVTVHYECCLGIVQNCTVQFDKVCFTDTTWDSIHWSNSLCPLLNASSLLKRVGASSDCPCPFHAGAVAEQEREDAALAALSPQDIKEAKKPSGFAQFDRDVRQLAA